MSGFSIKSPSFWVRPYPLNENHRFFSSSLISEERAPFLVFRHQAHRVDGDDLVLLGVPRIRIDELHFGQGLQWSVAVLKPLEKRTPKAICRLFRNSADDLAILPDDEMGNSAFEIRLRLPSDSIA